jgi:hypothetical protein
MALQRTGSHRPYGMISNRSRHEPLRFISVSPRTKKSATHAGACPRGPCCIRGGRNRSACEDRVFGVRERDKVGIKHAYMRSLARVCGCARISFHESAASTTQRAIDLRCCGSDPACLPIQDSFACPTDSRPTAIIHGRQAANMCD